MKLYQKSVLHAKSLRTGLLAVYFIAVVAAVSACGSEDKLLSELREEDTLPEDLLPGRETEDTAPDGGDTGRTGTSDGAQSGNALSAYSEMPEADADGGAVRNAGRNAGTEASKIYVHVCGAVKSPGVYELPAGSRFYEAVDAAGGFTEDACRDYLNMAALLADGSRLEIPALQEIQAGKEAERENGKPDGYHYYTVMDGEENTPEGTDEAGEAVNINTADIDRLCSLPGIGEGRAKAIIEYREKQGGFQKKEDIMQVSGIGEKMYARMEEYLTVE